ncbi:hypothetical protein FRC07_002149 [Ceratobasidium sp. 392]|nr:hypothetical protein FRC07_002149 [Ceratobasidium sp. 392]
MTAVVALVVTSSTSFIRDLPHLTFGDLMKYTNSIWFAYRILDYAVFAPYDHVLRAIDQGILAALSWLFFPAKFVYHAYDAKVVRVVVCFLVTLVFCLVKLALANLARGATSASRHVARLLLARVDLPGFLRTLLAPNRFAYSACVFGRAMIAIVWAKTATCLMSIPSCLPARLSEPWSAPPTAFTFAVNKAKIVEKRRALRQRFSKSRRCTKHGIELSHGNFPSSLDEQYWDALEDFLDSAHPLTTAEDARLNDNSNSSPGTVSPVFGPDAASGAPVIAQSFDTTDFAASPSPCPTTADDKLLTNRIKNTSPTNTSFEPTPAEPKPERKPADKPKSSVKPSPEFKLPVDFSLSRSSAHFKLGDAPQFKSLEQLPIQPQLYPGVKPCSCQCDLDVASLTSLFGHLKLDSSKPGSTAEQTPDITGATAGKKATEYSSSDEVADEIQTAKGAVKMKEKARTTENEKDGVPNVKVPVSSPSAPSASRTRRGPASSGAPTTGGNSNPARIPQDVIMADPDPNSAPLDGASRKRKIRACYMAAESDSEDDQETLESQPAEQRKLAGRVAARLAAQERTGFDMSD